MKSLFQLGASALMLLCASTHAAEAPAVKIDTGTLVGHSIAEGAVFKGIPYAAPPVGELRWQLPQPPERWDGQRTATESAAPCAQPDLGWNRHLAQVSSEDCLYLDVYTPKADPDARQPVMVWIHGGGFAAGTGFDPGFAGAQFIARGVILVALNYRLGPFGYLAHPALSAATDSGISGNYGMADQIAALAWVHRNIAAFGGDPDNVTVFGQSAGGGSVMNLLIAPQTADLIDKAIIQSGAMFGVARALPLAEAERIGTQFAEGEPLEQLRRASTDSIIQRYARFAASHSGFPFGPVVDGHFIPRDQAEAYRQAQQHRVPLIIGSNARDGIGRIPPQAVPAAVKEMFGASAAAVMKHYPANEATDPVLGDIGEQFITDTTFRCGSVILARHHHAAGAPVWLYHFEHLLPGREAEGAQHNYELPYVFGNLLSDGFLGGAYGERDRALAAVMLDYWTQFARLGNPNSTRVPRWPGYGLPDEAYQRLAASLPRNAAPAHRLRGELCDIYEQMLAKRSDAAAGKRPGHQQ